MSEPTKPHGYELDTPRALELVERAFDGVIVIGADQRIVRVDANAARLTGYAEAELLGAPLDRLLPEGLVELHRRYVREFMASGDRSRWVGRGHRRTSLRRRDGASLPVEITLATIDGERVAALLREAGERVRAEDALVRATRSLRVLSAMNDALEGADDEAAACERMCGVVVASAGHAMAWVGLVDDDAPGTLRVAARAGVDEGYVDEAVARWRAGAETSVRAAMRQARVAVVTRGREAPRLPHASCASLPLMIDGEAVGALEIHAREADAFDARELDLLSELARGLGRACALIRARHERRRAEARLSEVLRTVGVVAWSARVADGRITYMSDAAHLVFGRPVEEFTGGDVRWTEVVHADDHAAWREAFARVEEVGHADLEYRVVRPDGAARWLHASVRGVRDERGALVRRDGIAVDVTARREAEIARAASDQRFREIAENIRDIFWVFDRESARFTYVSPAYAAICGRPAGDVLEGSPTGFLAAIHPIDRQRLTGEILRRAAGEAGEIEYRVVRPDGVVRWLRDRSFVVADGSGRAARIVGVASDVTGQRQLDERLRASTGLLQAVLDTLPFHIAVLDEEGTVVTVNSAWSRDGSSGCGWAARLSRGESLFDPRARPEGVDADSARRAEAGIRAVLEGRAESFDIEYGCTCRSRPAFRALHVAALIQDEAPRRAVMADADVTERRLAAEALTQLNIELEQRVEDRTAELRQANAALERASRAKDEFLASMSHELRTPLNAVLGLSELLQEEIHGPINGRQRATLSRIEESGRHLLALINDILDIAKIEAGKISLDPGPVLLHELCRASVRLVQEGALRKRLVLSCEVSPAPAVVLDDRRMKQVIVNLLSNAVKFTPEGGRIGLEAGVDEQTSAVRIAVWDTGIGIAPEDISRLFQPFVQLDSRLSRQHAGTGLGLSLVRGLVALSGGSVEVESTPGVGSRFTVTLPLRWAAPRARSVPPSALSPSPEAPPEAHRKQQVLVAEDDHTNILVVVDFLESRGYEVRVARDGREVVEMARASCPDVVLMDIQMPVLDGLEATAELRADPSSRIATVPIIAVTALAMPGDRERCLSAGADEHLTKPVSLRRLATLIEELIAARPA